RASPNGSWPTSARCRYAPRSATFGPVSGRAAWPVISPQPTSPSSVVSLTIVCSRMSGVRGPPGCVHSSRTGKSSTSVTFIARLPPRLALAPERRVEGIAQPVADHVDRQRGHHDGEAGEGGQPPGLGQVLPPVVEHG